MQESPIFAKTYDLLLWLVSHDFRSAGQKCLGSW